MRLVEHRCLFQIRFASFLDVPPMLNSESVLEVALYPHLPDDVAILGHVCARHKFDEKAWSCGGSCQIDNGPTRVKTYQAQWPWQR